MGREAQPREWSFPALLRRGIGAATMQITHVGNQFGASPKHRESLGRGGVRVGNWKDQE